MYVFNEMDLQFNKGCDHLKLWTKRLHKFDYPISDTPEAIHIHARKVLQYDFYKIQGGESMLIVLSIEIEIIFFNSNF